MMTMLIRQFPGRCTISTSSSSPSMGCKGSEHIIVQLLSGFIAAAMNVCRFASLTQAFSSQANAAQVYELAEHKVATFGFEEPTPGFKELVLRFVQQPVERIVVWESP